MHTVTNLDLLSFLKPFDVINTDGAVSWWNLPMQYLGKRIQWYQKKLFGSRSRWRDKHTMLYLDASHILSVTFPHAKWETIDTVNGGQYNSLSIYRHVLFTPSTEHCASAIDAANKDLIGKDYDVGQLMCMALNMIFGDGDHYKIKWFDFSPSQKVCSVGVRAIFEMVRNLHHPSGLNRLFTWPDGHETDIEMTMPAHFANAFSLDESFFPVLQVSDKCLCHGLPPPPLTRVS